MHGSNVKDVDEWLQQNRPRRRAQPVQSPNVLDHTKKTDGSTQPSQPSQSNSQISDAVSEALRESHFDDNYTGSSEKYENEDRSVNTDNG